MINYTWLKNASKTYFLQKRYDKIIETEDYPLKNNFIIEFLGPPGVGKTTYSNFLMQNLGKEEKIASAEEIYRLLSAGRIKENASFREYHKILLNDFLNYMHKEKEITEFKLKKIRFGLSQLEKDAYLTHVNGLVLDDEGISHHFTKLIMDNIRSNKSFPEKYLKNRLIIFLDAPFQVIYKRIKDRMNDKKPLCYDKKEGFTDGELLQIVENDLKIKNEFYSLIKGINEKAIFKISGNNKTSDNIDYLKKIIEEQKRQSA